MDSVKTGEEFVNGFFEEIKKIKDPNFDEETIRLLIELFKQGKLTNIKHI